MVGSSTISRGSGEAHDPPVAIPVGRHLPAPLGREPLGLVPPVDRTDRLGRPLEGRVVAVHHDLGQQGRNGPPAELVGELLLEEVPDHPLGLGAQHVERLGLLAGGRIRLKGQQPDLRTVPVRDDDLMLAGELGDRAHRDRDIAPLRGGVGALAPAQQGVASECRDQAHEGLCTAYAG